jgi:hypothetical protein
MVSVSTNTRRHLRALMAGGAILAAAVAVPGPAHARVWVGFGFPFYYGPPAYYGPPPYYPPPAYYPPPPYYPPPATYYPPPSAYAPGYSAPSAQSCYAGVTVCPMERPVASGSACYCTTAQGRAWGRAG